MKLSFCENQYCKFLLFVFINFNSVNKTAIMWIQMFARIFCIARNKDYTILIIVRGQIFFCISPTLIIAPPPPTHHSYIQRDAKQYIVNPLTASCIYFTFLQCLFSFQPLKMSKIYKNHMYLYLLVWYFFTRWLCAWLANSSSAVIGFYTLCNNKVHQ